MGAFLFAEGGRIDEEANDPFAPKAGNTGAWPVGFMLSGWGALGSGLSRTSIGLAEGALYAQFTAFLLLYGAVATYFGTRKSFGR